jgi:hypothetical protein
MSDDRCRLGDDRIEHRLQVCGRRPRIPSRCRMTEDRGQKRQGLLRLTTKFRPRAGGRGVTVCHLSSVFRPLIRGL